MARFCTLIHCLAQVLQLEGLAAKVQRRVVQQITEAAIQ